IFFMVALWLVLRRYFFVLFWVLLAGFVFGVGDVLVVLFVVGVVVGGGMLCGCLGCFLSVVVAYWDFGLFVGVVVVGDVCCLAFF
ncbi:hypothetical protein ABTC93_20150, partial [Acinetobacter baumannii]